MKNAPPAATSIIALVLAGLGCTYSTLSQDGRTAASDPHPGPYHLAVERIAEAIERLKPEYPQLAGFSSRDHCNRIKLEIHYGYNTHRAPHRGGWTSGVPNPDEDGVWFYIGFYEPDSQREIHTQPRVPRYRYKDKRVTFLILEGEQTENISAAIFQILRDNGVDTDDGRQ